MAHVVFIHVVKHKHWWLPTLGNDKDAQMYDLLTEKGGISDTFMVNYNFPGFSVGKLLHFALRKKKLGHGNLARRALEPIGWYEQTSNDSFGFWNFRVKWFIFYGKRYVVVR